MSMANTRLRRCAHDIARCPSLTDTSPTLVFVALATTGYAQESRTYYSTDVLGSPTLATDANGNVIWSESYTPFGDRLTSSSASFDNNRWFTSAPQNQSSGLVDFGSRHYDPELGRFLGIDPVPVVASNSQTFNMIVDRTLIQRI